MRNLIWIATVFLLTSCGNFQSPNHLSDQSFESIFPVNRIHKDSTIKVTKTELIYLIQKGTSILKEKKVKDLSDDEHILTIMLLNTKSLYIPEHDKEINSEISKFSKCLDEMEYARKV